MTDTSKWKFNHTMLRVKDPQKSVDYYKLLGLSLINKMENKDANFDLYFLGESGGRQVGIMLTTAAYDGKESAQTGKGWTDRQGVLVRWMFVRECL